MKFNLRYTAVYYVAICCFIVSCAQIRGLEGGKKDETPAIILGADPPVFTTNFLSQKIRIDFDEYVVLNNINQELIVSPPLKKPVKATVKKKSVVIELQEPLLDNTTYTFNFGDAITDVREGNKTPLLYVISTGDAIDSLVVKGDAKIAWTGLAPVGAKVMLYADMEKHHILKENPSYFSKVKADGTFEIPYLAPGDYQLVVLDDADGNYHLDTGENVGFISDSVPSSVNDSLTGIYHLKLSPDQTERPFIPDYKTDSLGILSFPFEERFGMTEVRVLEGADVEKTSAYNLAKDSIFIWLKGAATDNRVTVQLAWRDSVLDTLDIPFFKTRQQENWAVRTGFGKKVRQGEPLTLITEGWSELGQAGTISVKEDSLTIPITIERDSLWPVRFLVRGQWKPGKNYELLVLPNGILNGGGKGNDTLKTIFSVFKPEDFGQVTIDINGALEKSMYLELENARSQVVFQGPVKLTGTQIIQNIEPGEYTARIIDDMNGNNRWDPISYRQNIQPEEVWIYPGKITVRANWEIKLKWHVDAAGN